MTGMFRIIMAANGITEFGACPFEILKDKLRGGELARIPHDAKSVIMVAFPYRTKQLKNKEIPMPDYKKIAGRLLEGSIRALKKTFAGYTFEYFVGDLPVPELYSAALCGLGKIGDNGLLINRSFGSWCFIGAIITDLELPYTVEEILHCRHCGLCSQLCPEKAIGKTGGDTILCPKGGGFTSLCRVSPICGCELCQSCCPENEGVSFSNVPLF